MHEQNIPLHLGGEHKLNCAFMVIFNNIEKTQ